LIERATLAIVRAVGSINEEEKMDRRQFGRGALALAGAWPVAGTMATAAPAQKDPGDAGPGRWRAIEAAVSGRLGVAVLDTATGACEGQRLDERFAMCSTFKFVAVAMLLARVDAGRARLADRIVVTPESLIDWSPVTRKHVGKAMSVAALCEAAITVSDNAAANLLLAHAGGPPAVTAFARRLGDDVTRLDRNEPTLNEGTPGDPRDTSTPRAMAQTLRRVLLGDALSDANRVRLVAWMSATSTGPGRLRAGLPADWRLAHKTGTGRLGTTNDIGVAWPPGRAPLVLVSYLTECSAPEAARESALADVARVVAGRGA
jgi:beta-lactamase class A